MIKTAIGQDSHRFAEEEKPLILGGILIKGEPGLAANSDGDVLMHALTNAVSGITGVNILGTIADDLCLNKGIKDSAKYLKEALKYLAGWQIVHCSLSVEAARPKMQPHIAVIKQNLATLLDISEEDMGLTATSGEGLTAFGRGEGIQVFCILTAHKSGN